MVTGRNTLIAMTRKAKVLRLDAAEYSVTDGGTIWGKYRATSATRPAISAAATERNGIKSGVRPARQ